MLTLVQHLSKRVKDAANSLTRRFTKKQIAFLAVVALALVVIFQGFIRALLLIAILFVIGVFSTYYKRKLEDMSAMGFELVTSTSVIAGIAFGPLFGAVFGFATALVSVTLSRDVGVTTILFLLATVSAGAAAQLLSSFLRLVATGMVLLTFSMLLVQSYTFFLQRENLYKVTAVIGILVNFAVNYLFLSHAAGTLLALVP
ncbi:hypothetical protein HYU40_04640 [Candidatus Woesearchaeota archaeon]|nr:hypothetical protein [Candidatus Woesearchaeota archaeon]